jgi:GT2 family glycosyltransferase
MPEPGKVGVVTVTYNSEKVIDAFMECMLKQDCGNLILYVIDNSSSDLTMQKVSAYQDPRVVLIANSRNVGVAEGNNQGIRAALEAECDYVLLINNDTEFGSSLISALRADCCKYQCDMIVPKIMYYDRPEVLWYAGGGLSRVRATGFHYGVGCRDTGQFDIPCQVDYAPTCCMLIHREVFKRVGLMDARYFVYFDDTDFCFRARRCGQKLYYSPSQQLFHKVSSLTGGGETEFSIVYITRNHVYYIAKNLGWLPCVFYLPLYQLSITAKLVTRRLSLRGYRASQAGFWDGIRMSFWGDSNDHDHDLPISRDVIAAKGKVS